MEQICSTCQYWNMYEDSTGECVKLLNCWKIKFNTERTEEFGEYGRYYIDHPVIGIDTDKDFSCSEWSESK